MRHSGQVIEISALCEMQDGTNMLVMCEARGYDAIGLTRYQFAEIIFKSIPGIRHAVCLDGGFSAQILMRNKRGKMLYAMPDPEKRNLGISIVIQDDFNMLMLDTSSSSSQSSSPRAGNP
jgi:exopolysaccharide biosynthesis protein